MAPDAAEKGVETDIVDKLSRVSDVPDGEVAFFAGREGAGIRPAQRGGGVAGNTQQALLHGEAKLRCSHVHCQQQRV